MMLTMLAVKQHVCEVTMEPGIETNRTELPVDVHDRINTAERTLRLPPAASLRGQLTFMPRPALMEGMTIIHGCTAHTVAQCWKWIKGSAYKDQLSASGMYLEILLCCGPPAKTRQHAILVVVVTVP